MVGASLVAFFGDQFVIGVVVGWRILSLWQATVPKSNTSIVKMLMVSLSVILRSSNLPASTNVWCENAIGHLLAAKQR